MSRWLNQYGLPVDFNRRIPDKVFHSYTGFSVSVEPRNRSEDMWTAAAFSRDLNLEHLMVLGSNMGFVEFSDVREVYDADKFVTTERPFQVTGHMISDITFVPESHLVLAGTGVGDLLMVDVERREVERLLAHEKVVRQISVHPKEPNIFASCSRDGSICIWDKRIIKGPRIRVQRAHDLLLYSEEKQPVNCLIHVDEHTLATGGGMLMSGVRLWDLRYQKVNQASARFETPGRNGRILTLGVDRSSNKLFAVKSKDRIFEYFVRGDEYPKRAYYYPPQNSFRSKMKMSPFSDHFIVTNKEGGALLYDFQDPENYPNLGIPGNPLVKDQADPRFAFPGIVEDDGEWTPEWVVDWSVSGRYIFFAGLFNMMVWDREFVKDLPPLKRIKNEDIGRIVNDIPIKLQRLQYTEAYAKKVEDPKWNYSFGIEDQREMNKVVDLVAALGIRKRGSRDFTNDDLLPPSVRRGGPRVWNSYSDNSKRTPLKSLPQNSIPESCQKSCSPTETPPKGKIKRLTPVHRPVKRCPETPDSKRNAPLPKRLRFTVENGEVDGFSKDLKTEGYDDVEFVASDKLKRLSANGEISPISMIHPAPTRSNHSNFNQPIKSRVVGMVKGTSSQPEKSKPKKLFELFDTSGNKARKPPEERNFNKAAGAADYGKKLMEKKMEKLKKGSFNSKSFSSQYADLANSDLPGFQMANGSKEHIKEVKCVTPMLKKDEIQKLNVPLSSTTGADVVEKTKPPLDSNDLKNEPSLKHIEEHIIDHIQREILNVNNNVNWDLVAGLEQAKKALREIVVLPFLRKELFTGLRAPPKGVLLFGPPGTGKTLIAKCVANQAKATFFNVSVSTMTSKWVGEGEKLVRALFEIARLKLPSIIFIDEIDSLLSTRKDGEHESSRRMKTEFLVQMDGLSTDSEERLLVLGATNKPEEIDEAARRRFTKRLYIPLPEYQAREKMIQLLLSKEKHSLTDGDIHEVAEATEGFSGADMYNLAKEAAYCPIREVIEEIGTIPVEDIRPISVDDFLTMLPNVKPTVLSSELESYLDWDKKFGCHSKS